MMTDTLHAALLRFLYRKRCIEVEERKTGLLSPKIDVAAYQLDRVNEIWGDAFGQVPYYREMKRRLNLPATFNSLDEYQALMPILSKAQFMANRPMFLREGQKPEMYFITGGSTGQPVHIPAWKKEQMGTNQWVGRSWYGVGLGDRLILLWGHHHLLQRSNWPRWNGWKRCFKDSLLGYRRINAYNLRQKALQSAGRELLAFRPHYVIGYSTALYLFALANEGQCQAIQDLGLKAVFATAECFPHQSAPTAVEEFFGSPLGMEYGSVEGGAVAYTHPADGCYRVFWDTHLVEAEPQAELSGAGKLYLTKLTPCYTPLLRYEPGDLIANVTEMRGQEVSVIAFDQVLGRTNDLLELSDGTLVHLIAIDDVLDFDTSIVAYQVVKEGKSISLNLVYREKMTSQAKARLSEGFAKIHPDLGRMEIRQVEALEPSIAGKAPQILRKT